MTHKIYSWNEEGFPPMSKEEMERKRLSFKRWNAFYEFISKVLPWLVGMFLALVFFAAINLLLFAAVYFFV